MSAPRKRPPVNMRRQERTPLRERLAAWWQHYKNPADPGQEPEADADEDAVEPESGWWSWVIWGTAALCVAIVGLAALNLHDFQTRIETGIASKFEVVGAKRVTDNQVLVASGVRWGTPLTAIDRNAISRAIEKLPWVRRAEVEAELPNKVTFRLTEYVPYALLLGDAKLMIVDKDGFVFKEAELGEAGDLPVITGFPANMTRDAHIRLAGVEETAEQRRLRSVLRLIEAHGRSQLVERFPLSEVHWDPVLGTTLVSARDGAEIRLGRSLQAALDQGLARAARVLAQADRNGEWLRYALLDDEVRPDRVVVGTERQGPLAGGAGSVGLPKDLTADKKDAPGAADAAEPD